MNKRSLQFLVFIFFLSSSTLFAGEAKDLYLMAEAEESFEGKVTLYRKLQRDHEGSVWAARAYLDLGEIYLLKGENSLAIRECSVIVKKYSDAPFLSRVYYLLGISHIASGDIEKGKAILERVVSDYGGTGDANSALERINSLGKSSPAREEVKKYFLQVGVYSGIEGAETYKRKLFYKGLEALIIPGDVFKVVLGPFNDDIEAKIKSENLKKEKGIDSFVIEN